LYWLIATPDTLPTPGVVGDGVTPKGPVGAPPKKSRFKDLDSLLILSCDFLSLANWDLAYSSVGLNANNALYSSTAWLYKASKLVKFLNLKAILLISFFIYVIYDL
jgi:hypothetical protein